MNTNDAPATGTQYTAAQTALAKAIDRMDAEVARLERLAPEMGPIAAARAGAASAKLTQARAWLVAAYDALDETVAQRRDTLASLEAAERGG